MSFCLPKPIAKTFRAALASGKVNPGKLAVMSSDERRAFFTEIVGEENATGVNTLFESKLLLKNQQQGMINWAKQLTGITEPVRRDIIKQIENLQKVLTPADQTSFLEDLAAKRLGADITIDEAHQLASLSKKVSQTRAELTPENRLEYGRARVALQNFVNDLKNASNALTVDDFKKNPGGSTLKGVSNLAGLAKSLKASLDNSVIGRQGLKVLFTNPTVWARNSAKTFQDIVRTFGGADVMNEVKAEVLSRPNALNGAYAREKLAVGVVEEAYPTSLPERIPVFGRAFKASQDAFTAFQYRTRADIFDRYLEIAEKSGADPKGIGKLANALTGRGDLAVLGVTDKGAAYLNNLFFSPRFLKSNIDLLTAHALDADISPFARKQAAANLVKVVGGVASILAIANALRPGSVEFDARSSDFGKIKIGATRFDVSGGMASVATLATRLVTQESKSTTSGRITKIDDPDAFKGPTTLSILGSFMENKLSPLASYILSLRKGRDRFTDAPLNLTSAEGIKNSAINLTVPIPVTNYFELRDNPDSAPILAAMIADALGIGTNTY